MIDSKEVFSAFPASLEALSRQYHFNGPVDDQNPPDKDVITLDHFSFAPNLESEDHLCRI